MGDCNDCERLIGSLVCDVVLVCAVGLDNGVCCFSVSVGVVVCVCDGGACLDPVSASALVSMLTLVFVLVLVFVFAFVLMFEFVSVLRFDFDLDFDLTARRFPDLGVLPFVDDVEGEDREP